MANIALRAVNTNIPAAINSIVPAIGSQTTRAQQAGLRQPPMWKHLTTNSTFRVRAVAILNILPEEMKGKKPGKMRNVKLKDFIRLTVSPYISGKSANLNLNTLTDILPISGEQSEQCTTQNQAVTPGDTEAGDPPTVG